MKRTLPLWSLLILACTATAHAQMYKFVGPDGKVTYTDTPPPASARNVETKALGVGAVNTSGFPYELSEAVKTSPVTLYTTRNCEPCEDARKLLSTRGIPFSEKTVISNEDIAEFRKAHGNNELPVLLVGRNKEKGFEPSGWNATLTAAGYPESSKLPRNYRNPPPEAAAPAPRMAAAPEQSRAASNTTPAASASELPPATGNAPPGFRF